MPNNNEKNNKHRLQRTALKLFVIVSAFVCCYVHIENWNVRASDVCGRQSKRYWWEKHKLLKYEPQKHRSTANQMKWSISKSKWVCASEKENGVSMQTSVLLCFFCFVHTVELFPCGFQFSRCVKKAEPINVSTNVLIAYDTKSQKNYGNHGEHLTLAQLQWKHSTVQIMRNLFDFFIVNLLFDHFQGLLNG